MIRNTSIFAHGFKAAAVLLLASGVTAFAIPSVTLNTNSYSDSFGGGEFTAVGSGLSTTSYSSTTLMSGGFETFCLAYNEEFVPGTSYNYTLGSSVLSDTHGAALPISKGVAYLYSQFAAGTLAGYDYSLSGAGGAFASRQAAATALQVALWWAEGEETGGTNSQGAPAPDSSDNYYVNLLNADFPSNSALNPATVGYDGVQLLVLSNSDTSKGSTPYSQPQLYYHNVPDNGTTILLVGVGLMGLVALRRKLKKA
jgi:hypothetical protein